MELNAIPKELYNYYRSLSNFYDATGDPFAEPVIVYTNIVDGIGILGSTSKYVDSLVVYGNYQYGPYNEK